MYGRYDLSLRQCIFFIQTKNTHTLRISMESKESELWDLFLTNVTTLKRHLRRTRESPVLHGKEKIDHAKTMVDLGNRCFVLLIEYAIHDHTLETAKQLEEKLRVEGVCFYLWADGPESTPEKRNNYWRGNPKQYALRYTATCCPDFAKSGRRNISYEEHLSCLENAGIISYPGHFDSYQVSQDHMNMYANKMDGFDHGYNLMILDLSIGSILFMILMILTLLWSFQYV